MSPQISLPLHPLAYIVVLAGLTSPTCSTAADSAFAFAEQSDRLAIRLNGEPVTEYVFGDEQILRPYFANLSTSTNTKVTRNHPPRRGADDTYHDTKHPGVWLAFGDINGHDFWRNEARIKHLRFSAAPVSENGRLTFSTQSQLVTAANEPLGILTCSFTLVARPLGRMLIWDAELHAQEVALILGDQEEMGFGARVATSIAEKNGGSLVNSNGQRSAAQTWGRPAAWCHYSGTYQGQIMGILVMADASNFRESWWHNRDYGLTVANPFGRSAMRQGDKSAVVVNPSKPLRLRFGAMIHAGSQIDPLAEFAEFTAPTQP